MGFYIETDSAKNKAAWLVKNAGATLLAAPKFLTGESTTVCVVDNGPFEAAAIAYSPEELRAFNNPRDSRPVVWLAVPTKEVLKHCPYVKEMLRTPN